MKFVRILVIAALLIILSGCSAQDYFSTDTERYGHWGKSAGSILSEAVYLPSVETVSAYGQDYYYRESKSPLGDKNIVMYVDLHFPDKKLLEAELDKLSHALPEPSEYGGSLLYPLRFSPEAANSYMDGEILDGMYYDFEFIDSDPGSGSLKVVIARVWDYFEDERLMEWLVQAAAVYP